ncbi:MAG: nucleotidyltransferase [Bacilli bacterium]|nr:nucleotidyltransferase [Bacilli bacterium]
MKSVGIICEYNPLHNGHIYHINKVREIFPDHLIILILSGNFTQRGEVSLINKWKKTEIALNYVDLVIELPFVFASQSADLFAKGSADILKALNVDALVFGSESDDVNRLKKLAKITESKKYDNLVKKYLDEGLNYPTSLSKALKTIGGEVIDTSNDLLGFSYVKELINTNIELVTIKRTNDYLSKNLDHFITSATSIREGLKKGINIKKYVPSISYKYLKKVKFLDDYFDLIKYKIISEDISKYQTVDEGIENRLKKVINGVDNVDELINKIKTKRYTYNRIKRMLVHILTGFTKEEAKNIKTKYIRVLGFNNKGQKYLNSVKKKCSLPIITTFEKNNDLLDIEARVSDIYNLIKKDDNLSEHEHKPIH